MSRPPLHLITLLLTYVAPAQDNPSNEIIEGSWKGLMVPVDKSWCVHHSSIYFVKERLHRDLLFQYVQHPHIFDGSRWISQDMATIASLRCTELKCEYLLIVEAHINRAFSTPNPNPQSTSVEDLVLWKVAYGLLTLKQGHRRCRPRIFIGFSCRVLWGKKSTDERSIFP